MVDLGDSKGVGRKVEEDGDECKERGLKGADFKKGSVSS